MGNEILAYPKGPERPVSDEPDKLLSLSELKSRALSRMSPAELLKEQTPSGVSYREPLWSSLLSEQYWVEVGLAFCMLFIVNNQHFLIVKTRFFFNFQK